MLHITRLAWIEVVPAIRGKRSSLNSYFMYVHTNQEVHLLSYFDQFCIVYDVAPISRERGHK